MTHPRVVFDSPLGRQPMWTPDERFGIVFNGEIYNFRQLKRELEKRSESFRSGTDTEVLLQLVVHDGIHEALRRCRGMFALAIWDRKERQLWLARDRFGEKPLYYGVFGKTFLFASELGALRAHPERLRRVVRRVREH